ncbi:ATP-binding cassette domain-containing protein [Secundilactobacillus collinoides]|uniref:ATP-binding cassette domain-containing protein n=1 Tax=Secundilactobacillus collinoides TaxID=33960 RepID=UPI0006CF2F7A|nr:ATP-binding cassette domain-containing protein [Secundilactobacillus collinoides]
MNVLSGGERVKVSLAKMMLSDVNGLILDEPTNYLDIGAITALSDMLKDYGGTLIIVSHDRWFVRQVTSEQYKIVNQHLVNKLGLQKNGTKT